MTCEGFTFHLGVSLAFAGIETRSPSDTALSAPVNVDIMYVVLQTAIMTQTKTTAKTRDELAYAILRVLRPLVIGAQRTLERRAGRKSPSSTKRSILDLLRQAGRPVAVPFLARALLLDRQPVQRVVDQLLRTKLLARLPNPDHLRSPLLTLSARGNAELDRIRAGEMTVLRKMIAPFPRKDLATCSAVLEHLRIEFAMRAAVLEQSKADTFEAQQAWLSTG